ncbi:hypothetical protein [Pseudoalteromonas sp. KAN5]|uniref:hypothetical protein n=1 Tax=Pseudoalteromonas sp. KAN5 TaxID=2916633 RepID=UPI001FCBEBAE|nr:hypothetical protein [Pseudoalteromonas sp. KAN5]BDF96489.1 hypothetical protein KAN5_33270 [Pseudoalteromonas sp. KAN5]
MITYDIVTTNKTSYSLKTAKAIFTETTKTITSVKDIMRALDIDPSTHRNEYLKILNLLKKGESLPAAVAQILGGEHEQ